METNLKAKAEKYETKAAQCEEWAREAMEGPERSLYGELADYYGKLATDFRRSHRKAEPHLAASARSRRTLGIFPD